MDENYFFQNTYNHILKLNKQQQQNHEKLTVTSYMQKMCDVAEKAILAKKKLRKKCINRDKM